MKKSIITTDNNKKMKEKKDEIEILMNRIKKFLEVLDFKTLINIPILVINYIKYQSNEQQQPPSNNISPPPVRCSSPIFHPPSNVSNTSIVLFLFIY